MSRIRIGVIHRCDCKNLVLRYKDPVTGRWSTSTKYRDPQTGIVTETGTNRKEAEKLGARWEADLNAGRDQGSGATTWQQFRIRYEDEVVDSLAGRTATKIWRFPEAWLLFTGKNAFMTLPIDAVSMEDRQLMCAKVKENGGRVV